MLIFAFLVYVRTHTHVYRGTKKARDKGWAKN